MPVTIIDRVLLKSDAYEIVASVRVRHSIIYMHGAMRFNTGFLTVAITMVVAAHLSSDFFLNAALIFLDIHFIVSPLLI